MIRTQEWVRTSCQNFNKRIKGLARTSIPFILTPTNNYTMSAAPSNTPIDTVEALEAQMAALEQQMPAACAEKAHLAAEAEEKHLE
jgi:hypothetical protein